MYSFEDVPLILNREDKGLKGVENNVLLIRLKRIEYAQLRQ